MNAPTLPAEWESHLAEITGDEITGKHLLDRPENRFLAPLIKPGLEVLEAGSGNGRYVFAFALAGAQAVGIDFSPVLTEKVQVAAQTLGLDNVLAVTGDILDLPFESNRFDVYTSFGVYEHFTRPQHKTLFSEAYRVLKPGGLLYLEVPHFWSAWTVRREIRYRFRKLCPPSIVWQRNVRRNYFLKMAAAAGFIDDESHVIDAWYGFQKGFSLDCAKLSGVPNPFYALRPLFRVAADVCEPREWLGHTLIYIGQKPLD